MQRALESFRKHFPDTELIAGNVATTEGARFLLDLGADGIKVGIGPGGGCTTRITTSFGVPQVQALVECRLAVADSGIGVIADGGIKRHGRSRWRCCSAATAPCSAPHSPEPKKRPAKSSTSRC